MCDKSGHRKLPFSYLDRTPHFSMELEPKTSDLANIIIYTPLCPRVCRTFYLVIVQENHAVVS